MEPHREPPPEEPRYERWCRGCRRVGARRLEPHERSWADGRRRACRRHAWLGLGIFPAALLTVSFLASSMAPRGEAGTAVTAAAMMFALLLALPVSILVVRDHLAAAARLKRDLAIGEAWVFEPPGEAHEARIEAPDSAAPGAPQSFALLPESRRLLDLSNRDPVGEPEDVTEVLPHTGGEWHAPLSLEVLRSPAGMEFGQRALTAPELREIEAIRRGLLRPGPGTVLGALAGAWLGWMFIRTPAAALLAKPGELVASVGWLLLCGLAVARYARAVRVGLRLAHDVRLGIVVLARSAESGDEEMLPASGLLWRSKGSPAGWRDRDSALDRLRRGL